jgi:hypothetical protein
LLSNWLSLFISEAAPRFRVFAGSARRTSCITFDVFKAAVIAGMFALATSFKGRAERRAARDIGGRENIAVFIGVKRLPFSQA